MTTWHWHDLSTNHARLTCSLLEPFPHGFFTRLAAPYGPSHLVECLAPGAPVFRLRQVHGNTLYITHEIVPDLEGDGLFSTRAGNSLWVCSADCTPVLIVDGRLGWGAALHAGWRGTAARIVPLMIERFQGLGSQIADLRIALGPAISGPNYQVAKSVALQVVQTLAPTPGDELTGLLELPGSPLGPDPDPGRVRLDIRRVIAQQLLDLGVDPEQVATAPYCTHRDQEWFFSYRRDQQKQVQWSAVVTRAPAAELDK